MTRLLTVRLEDDTLRYYEVKHNFFCKWWQLDVSILVTRLSFFVHGSGLSWFCGFFFFISLNWELRPLLTSPNLFSADCCVICCLAWYLLFLSLLPPAWLLSVQYCKANKDSRAFSSFLRLKITQLLDVNIKGNLQIWWWSGAHSTNACQKLWLYR